MPEFTLPNQLRVVMCPTPGPGVCTLNITYLVGSNSEKIGETGYTHILEHMMFKESKEYPAGMWWLEKQGAQMNATTYLSRTNYYETMPTEVLKSAISREAARMANPVFRPEALKRELTVVDNEAERGANNCFQVMNSELISQAYQNASWRHSTIGSTADRNHATCEALAAYQKKRYTPANAIVFVTGQFDVDETKKWITEYFSDIPSGERVSGVIEEPPQEGMRRFVKNGDAHIVGIGFKGPRGMTRDAIALQVWEYVMNKPVNMFRPMVDAGVAYNVQAAWQRVSHPYLFTLWASAPHVDVAEQSLWKVVDNMHIDQKEFETAKKALSQKWHNDVNSSQKLALELNEAAARGDYRDVFTRHDVLLSLTLEDMQNARRYFVRERSTVGLMTNVQVSEPVAPKEYNMTNAPELEGGLIEFRESRTENGRYILAPGNVHVRLTYDGMECGRAMFTAATLARGYKQKCHVTEEQVSSAYAVDGVTRAMTGDWWGVHVNYDGPVTHLETLKNELECPVCDRKQEVKRELVSETMSKTNVVRDMAISALKKAVFEQAQMPNELATQIHSSTEGKLGNCRVTAMAPDAETLVSIKNMFERGTSSVKQYTPRASPQHVVNIKLQNKSSNFVAYGVAAETTLPLKLAAGVLGNGFAGRLMQHVRDKLGLTYGIYANANDQLFYIQATFAPRLMDRGIAEMKKVYEKWKQGVTEEELNVQKKMLINSRRVAFDDPGTMIDVLHREHLREKTYHAEAVSAVTLKEVNDAIRALGTCTLVKAGTF